MIVVPESLPRRSLVAASTVLAAGSLLLFSFPGLKLAFFARGAARLASLFLGTPVFRFEHGWMLPSDPQPVLVTSACSGADFFLMAATLLAWQLGRQGRSVPHAVGLAFFGAVPFAIAVNATRIAAVTQAHRWFIPRWPPAYQSFLHLLTGVAVFLPALILLHVLLEYRRNHSASAAA